MIFESFDHTLVTFEVSLFVSRIFCQSLFAIAHTVRLDIGFANHIQAIQIAEIIPQRIIRIVAGPDTVNVVLLHDADILNHPFRCNVIAGQRIHLMTVHPFEKNRLAIDPYLTFVGTQFNLTESDPLVKRLQLLSRSITQRQLQLIKIGLFRTPFANIAHLHAQPTTVIGIELSDYRCEFTLFAAQRHFYRTTDNIHPLHIDLQTAGAVSGIQIGNHSQIFNPLLWPGIQIDIASNTRQPPKVLIFEVGTVTPTINLHSDQIFASFEIGRDIKIGTHLAILAVTDKTAIDPYIEVRGSRPNMQKDISTVPIGRQIERAAIRTDMVIFLLNERRIIGKLARPHIRHIGVNRIAITVHLPQRRYREIHPSRIIEILLGKGFWALIQVFDPIEFPQAIQ